MKPLLFVLLLLAPSARAQEDVSKSLQALKAKYAAEGQRPPQTDPGKPARCEGPGGKRRYLHVILYQQNRVVGTNFTNDIRSLAAAAFLAHNVELMKPRENGEGTGGDQLFSYPKDADCERRSPEDKKRDPLCAIAVEDQIAFCQVVREAFKAHAPPPGYLPVFQLWFGGSLKKQIGTDVAGQNYPTGSFKRRCEVVGEADGIPDTAFAVVDVRPEQEMHQVLAHEIGHAIGNSVGKPAWFEDLYPGVNAPQDVKNIMVSRKALHDAGDLVLSPFQVQALCSSPYVSDVP